MEAFQSLILKFVVLNCGVLADNKFRYRICEIGCLGKAHIAFDDRNLAVISNDNEVAGIARIHSCRLPQQNEVNRAFTFTSSAT